MANPNLEPGNGSPVSEQTPFSRSLELLDAPALGRETAPAAASRLPAIKKRRRVPLCSEALDPEPALVGEAGKAAGHAACQTLFMSPKAPAAGPWDADPALGSEARQAGGRTPHQTLAPDAGNLAAGPCDAVEDAALRQTGLWSPSSPIAGSSPCAASECEASFPTGARGPRNAHAALPPAQYSSRPEPANEPLGSKGYAPAPAEAAHGHVTAAANEAGASVSTGACNPWNAHAVAHARTCSPRTAPANGPYEREIPLPVPATVFGNLNPGQAARRAVDAAARGADRNACWALNTPSAHDREAYGLGAADQLSPTSAAVGPNPVPLSDQVPGAMAAGKSQARPAKRRIKLPCLPLLPGIAHAPQRAASTKLPAGFPSSSTAAACGTKAVALDNEARESVTTPQHGGNMRSPRASASLAVSTLEAAEPALAICGGAAGGAMHPEEKACAGQAGVGRPCAILPAPVLEQAAAMRSHKDDWASVFSFL